jgi:hypothetical protein
MQPNKCSLKNKTFKTDTTRRSYTLSFFLLTLFLLTAYSLPLNATIRYVSKTGTSEPPFLTWETSADSIQECINICVFGDTIYVANGVYEEQVVMIPGLSLIGAGADSCEINTVNLVTSQNYRCVETADSSLFTGFSIIVYNNSTWGIGIAVNGNSLVTFNKVLRGRYGILNGSNAIIYKNIFNYVSQGTRLFNSNAIVKSNSIYTDPNSQATIIAGIYVEAFNNNYQPFIDSNYIVVSNGYGIYKSIGSRPIINNNDIINVGIGIQLSSSDSAVVNNNSIIVPVGIESGYGIYNTGNQYLMLYNNQISGAFLFSILYLGPDNRVINNVISNTEGEIMKWGSQNFQYQYNNVWNSNVSYAGFTPDTTNLTVDPMIVNDDTTQGELDFHLQMYSPLIDAGDPTILDKDGSRSDIGLYGGPYGESYVYLDLPPRIPVNFTANVDSLIKLNWNTNTEADFNHYNVYRDTAFNFTVDSTKLIASVIDTFYYETFPSSVETLYYRLTAVDGQGNESNPSEQVYVKLVTVKNEWVPVNNYILYQNYPNPFNPSTKIGYKLKERGYVKLYVYDIKGELVSVLVNEVQESGYYEVEFSAKGGSAYIGNVTILASGVYIYQIFVKGENNIPVFSDIKKMVYVK